jgi:hypothetical protein
LRLKDDVVKKYVYNHRGDKLLRIEDDEPECGADICDTCGDCLSCDWEGPCLDGREHWWVVYEDDDDGEE